MRNIVTIDANKWHQQEEMKYIYNLTGTKLSCWNINLQPEGALWEKDSVTIIPGAGGEKDRSLIDVGVVTISDLQSKSNDDLKTIKKVTTGIFFAALHKWRSTNTHPGSFPGENKDNFKYLNLYLEKYGADDWEAYSWENIRT